MNLQKEPNGQHTSHQTDMSKEIPIPWGTFHIFTQLTLNRLGVSQRPAGWLYRELRHRKGKIGSRMFCRVLKDQTSAWLLLGVGREIQNFEYQTKPWRPIRKFLSVFYDTTQDHCSLNIHWTFQQTHRMLQVQGLMKQAKKKKSYKPYLRANGRKSKTSS